jgi:putative ABC transport system substrate-binding protein
MQISQLNRRELITVLGGAAVCPFTASAQQPERMRRVAMMMAFSESDAEINSALAAFLQTLRELGWTEGGNVQFDYRWAAADPGWMKRYAAELVSLAPDVIVASTLPVASALKQVTTNIPIVLAGGGDPVTSGMVSNLARPGGNVTGFSLTVPTLGGKWLELLKGLAPQANRVAVIHAPDNPNRARYIAAVEEANAGINVELTQLDAKGPEIGDMIDTFARRRNSALLILPGPSTLTHRNAIISAAERDSLPAIYPFRFFAIEGGLASYGADVRAVFRRVASYVDRILRGEKAGDLPVQQPTKFELIINLKTAKALGLDVPPTLLATADEVIE